jgi:formate dehydrogenase maturation protein FdhE
MKIKNILIGWGKSFGILPSSAAELKLAELRMKQCGNCADAKESNLLKLVNGNAEYVRRLVCTRCGCPSYQKTLVVSESCPISKW